MAEPDEKMLLARLGDLERAASRGRGAFFSRFLDPQELAVFNRAPRPSCEVMAWGGYEGSERQMLGFFPDYAEPQAAAFPLCALRAKCAEELGHRTLLGALMSLGIERSLIGDIAKEEDGSAVLFVCDSIADFIQMNVTRAGRSRLTLLPVPIEELRLRERAWEPVSGTVASLRLDCVLGLLTGQSRAAVEELLRREQVSVNFAVCTKGSVSLACGDVLSVRHFGRAELLEIGGESRKGRIWITLKRYV